MGNIIFRKKPISDTVNCSVLSYTVSDSNNMVPIMSNVSNVSNVSNIIHETVKVSSASTSRVYKDEIVEAYPINNIKVLHKEILQNIKLMNSLTIELILDNGKNYCTGFTVLENNIMFYRLSAGLYNCSYLLEWDIYLINAEKNIFVFGKSAKLLNCINDGHDFIRNHFLIANGQSDSSTGSSSSTYSSTLSHIIDIDNLSQISSEASNASSNISSNENTSIMNNYLCTSNSVGYRFNLYSMSARSDFTFRCDIIYYGKVIENENNLIEKIFIYKNESNEIFYTFLVDNFNYVDIKKIQIMNKCIECLKKYKSTTLEKNNGVCGNCIKKQTTIKKPPRKSIPSKIRSEVWKAQHKDSTRGKCYCCKKEITFDDFDCGHIVSVYDGGETTISNMRPICRSCNISCGKKNLDDFKKMFK